MKIANMNETCAREKRLHPCVIDNCHSGLESKLPDVITVFHGGIEDEDNVSNAIWWTTNKHVADLAAYRTLMAFGVGRVYIGKIRIADVLAFTDCPEHEVLQRSSVYGIAEI